MSNLSEIDKLFNIWLKYNPTEEKKEVEHNKQVKLDIKKIYCRKVKKKNKFVKKKEKLKNNSVNFIESMLSKNLLDEKSSEIIFSEENIIEPKKTEHATMTDKELADIETANKNRRKKRKNKFKALLGK